jgi:flagellin-specific chaperone FliS
MSNLKHLKPVQILTDDAIHLIERAKMMLEVYNDNVQLDKTTQIITELTELIEELKS